MAPNKIEIKREMLPIYQIKSTDFCNIPIGNITQLKLGIKLKKPPGIRIQSIRMAKIMLNSTHKKNRSRKKSRQKWKVIVQIAVYGKTVENLNRWKRLFEIDIKTKVYISKNIWQ